MPIPRGLRAARVAAAVVACVGAVYQLSLLVRLFAGRVRYPFDIEWLESSALYQAYRVKEGLSTYGPFKNGYIPLNHPPLYPALLGLLGKVTGVGYATARTLSLLFFVAASLLVARALVRQQKGRLEGFALAAFAAGAAAAGTPVMEAIYDLVRGDGLAVLLATLAAALVDGPPRMRPRRIALVAVVLTALVYTRLPAVFFPTWIIAFAFLRHRRTGLLLALATSSLSGLVLVALQLASKGWFWMLTVGLMGDHAVAPARFRAGFLLVLRFAPFLAAVPFAVAILAFRRRLSASAVLWTGMLVAAVPAALLPFAKVGGFSNDFMPLLFFLGPAAAFLVSDALLALDARPRAQAAVGALLAAGGVFLGLRGWDPHRFLPSAAQAKQAEALVAKVASLEGGVVCPRHPFLPIAAGHRTLQWSDMPYLDMVWSGYGDLALGAYLARTGARYALVTGAEVPLTQAELAARYQLEGPLVDAPRTVVGLWSQVRWILRLQDDDRDARVLFDFEGSLAGWALTGDAFQISGTTPKGQGAIAGAVGKQVANSFHPSKRDAARGTATSPPFVLDRPHLAFRVGGGWHGGTRVELRVDGKAVRKATGIFEGSETLLKQVWDVRDLMGKEARFVMIDDDTGTWGHLLVDQVTLF